MVLLGFFLMPVFVSLLPASKAVDCLLDSKWAKAKKGEEALFTTRDSVVDYCNRLAATTSDTVDEGTICHVEDLM